MPMSAFRNRLRKYRRAAGLTQTQVAAVLRLENPASVSRWERGEREPGPRHLLELSALYHRLVNELLWPEYRLARDRVNRRLTKLDITPRLG